MLGLYIFKVKGTESQQPQQTTAGSFKNYGNPAEYRMYVLFEEGILFFNNVDRRCEPAVVQNYHNEGLYITE